MRRGAPSQSTPKLRTSPKSPSRRVLSESKNQINTPQLFSSSQRSEAPQFDRSLFRHETSDKENARGDTQEATPRIMLPKPEKRRSGNFSSMISGSSPLKRSDGIMNLDQVSRGSPSAKRRSLHGPTFSPADFSVFEGELKAEEPRRHSEENEMFTAPGAPSSASHISGIPKRSSSLRKSTLQQRQHERPSQPNFRNRQRMSLDNFVPPAQRDSPFSSQGPLLNASIHVVGAQNGNQTPCVPHPLHQTMTQSSSNSSLADESPAREPSRRTERPKSMFDLSKSLPIGASRPLREASFTTATDRSGTSGSFTTPESYKLAKPEPLAFKTDGLVSKMIRDPNELYGGSQRAHMPDTPCKRHTTIFPLGSDTPPGTSNAPKVNRHSFGSPSTPFHFEEGKPKKFALSFAKRSNIRDQSNGQAPQRCTSFASIEGDDNMQSHSPSSRFNSQSTDSEFPNTPTKFVLHPTAGSSSIKPLSFHGQDSNSVSHEEVHGVRSTLTSTNPHISSFSSFAKVTDSQDEDSDSVMEDSPSSATRPMSFVPAASMTAYPTRIQPMKPLKSPTPLSRKDLQMTPFATTPAAARARTHSLSPASPLQDKLDRNPPQTPRENLLPPDPSRLSISGHNDREYFNNPVGNASAPPATPTAREHGFGDKRASLALAPGTAPDVDPSLMERFEKAEVVGNGEFSIVYRVTQPSEVSPGHRLLATPARSSHQISLPERVWAVKKSKKPYTGQHDRRRKLYEAQVLRSLTRSDHVIEFIDSWEDQHHLYIQTEYCEEGTLHSFLAKQGIKGRLDDFRIWKILLELTQGLKHIHDANFMHLDMKPANILVTFEGVLKIADFGMALKWPQNEKVDREGDREYLASEVMQGHVDKSADIFALGLIMLETAGNVRLPEYGDVWRALREGDLSDVPSLTWTSNNSTIFRGTSGNLLPNSNSLNSEGDIDRPSGAQTPNSSQELDELVPIHNKRYPLTRDGELVEPPDFMIDPSHDEALDNIVRWMIFPQPECRPIAEQILGTAGAQWAENRRRAGATVFEGNWGPADEVLLEDAEMMDV
ncbi:MAG: hypothetical protein Q9160_007392 [Pyrenula sp. 1 TL-2023]